MLKKFLVFSLFLVLATTVSIADVGVAADGKTQKYPDGSILNVAAARNLFVDYYGLKVFVPKGERVTLRCSDREEDNKIYFSGDKFKNLIVGDSSLSAQEQTSFVVSQDGDLLMEDGNLTVKDGKERVVVLGPGDTYKIGSLILAPEFIPERQPLESNYKQIEKDGVLSPSAPRN